MTARIITLPSSAHRRELALGARQLRADWQREYETDQRHGLRRRTVLEMAVTCFCLAAFVAAWWAWI